MKRCPNCGENKKNSGFYTNRSKRDRLQDWCIVCMKKCIYEREGKNKNKVHAKRKLNNAIEHGTIRRGLCVCCGRSENVDGHHEDYSKPLDVIWMCRSCHMKHHRGNHGKEVFGQLHLEAMA